MKNKQWLLSTFLLLAADARAYAQYSEENTSATATKCKKSPCVQSHKGPQGWSFDLGGQYTWMQFTTPPTFSGSTGGVVGKITYQKANEFFGQLRTVYNIGPLSAGKRRSGDSEWYTEVVGGYCVSAGNRWTITPYAGFGFDFLTDNKKAFSSFSDTKLFYRIYYVPIGVEFKYSTDTWYVGAQFDVFPTFNQYLIIKGLSGSAWKLSERVGWDVRIPVGFKLANHYWIELAPYYRLLPIGSSSALGLPHRNLNEYGAFVAFRFFI
jgi:hypothetical protein